MIYANYDLIIIGDDTVINIRPFKDGDEVDASKVITKTLMTVNIKDYPKEFMEKLSETMNPELIKKRSEIFDAYIVTDDKKIIGIGMCGPYWDSLTESSFFTIFLDPDYEGMGIGRKIIETLEQDKYFLRADRVEIPASLTALEFYRHFGYGFKKLGNIANEQGEYKLEKYPKISSDNNNKQQYNMRPYINNEYHNYYEFVYRLKKDCYINYVEENWGTWDEETQRQLFKKFMNLYEKQLYIIQLSGIDIGFYNGVTLNDGSYEIENICILSEYQKRGIGTRILKDILELHKHQDIKTQYFKQNPVRKLYERLGFVSNGETKYHYQMIKLKQK